MQKSHLLPTLLAAFGTAIISLLPAPARAEGEGRVADELAQKITQALGPQVASRTGQGFYTEPPFVSIQEERRADDPIIGIWELVKVNDDSRFAGRMFCAPNGSIDAPGGRGISPSLRWSITPIPQIYAAHYTVWDAPQYVWSDLFHLMWVSRDGQLVLLELGMENWQIEGVIELLQTGYTIEELIENYKKAGIERAVSIYRKRLPVAGKARVAATNVRAYFHENFRIEPNDPFVGIWQSDQLGGRITVHPTGTIVVSVKSREGKGEEHYEGLLYKASGTSVYRLRANIYGGRLNLLIYMDEKDKTWKWTEWKYSDSLAAGVVSFLKQGVPFEKAVFGEVYRLTKMPLPTK